MKITKFYNPEKAWSKEFRKVADIAYPAEGVIRIFKGKYPKLKINLKKNNKILDLGFGDGRHFSLLKNLGLKVYGCDIASEAVKNAKKNFKELKKNFNVSSCANINFKSDFFDLLLCWNSCYYMPPKDPFNFKQHINEMCRVLKKNGILILSIPKKTSFIFKNSKKIKKNFRIIKNDYFNIRNGQIMRCFENKSEIVKNLKNKFTKFSYGSIHDDWFGLNYHWHILVARKK